MLVTEVIVGASDEFVSYFGYLDEDGQSLLSFTKRKLRQQPPGFGIGTYHQTTYDPEVAAAGLRFLQAVGMRGLGNVEFKGSLGIDVVSVTRFSRRVVRVGGEG